eukprot:4956499-Pyramimonas_sp.AAC.1
MEEPAPEVQPPPAPVGGVGRPGAGAAEEREGAGRLRAPADGRRVPGAVRAAESLARPPIAASSMRVPRLGPAPLPPGGGQAQQGRGRRRHRGSEFRADAVGRPSAGVPGLRARVGEA